MTAPKFYQDDWDTVDSSAKKASYESHNRSSTPFVKVSPPSENSEYAPLLDHHEPNGFLCTHPQHAAWRVPGYGSKSNGPLRVGQVSFKSMDDAYSQDLEAFEYARSHAARRRKICRWVAHAVAILAAAVFLLWVSAPKYLNLGSRYNLPFVTTQPQYGDSLIGSTADLAQCGEFSCMEKTFSFTDVESFSLRNLIHSSRCNELIRDSFVQVLEGEQDEDVHVKFTFDITDATLQDRLEIYQSPTTLVFRYSEPKTPEDCPPKPQPRVCIKTQTKIFLRRGLKLKDLTVESTVLGITIPSPIDVWVDTSNLVLTAGSLDAKPMYPSRKTFVNVEAGSIMGTYPLYDVLSMRATAGSIVPEVVPQPALEGSTEPALLEAHSTAGTINIDYRTDDDIPDRDYRTNVQSSFGRITGNYIHGSLTTINTQTGDIDVSLLPFSADTYPSKLITTTDAGRLAINLLTPHNDAAVPMRRLTAKHTSSAGTVDVQYPATWEGRVEATTTMGSIHVQGDGLHVIKERKGMGAYIEAEKGDGSSSSLVKTTQGAVKFTVG